jgi:hypothetical protein
MRAKVRRLHSPDIHNLETYVPDEPDTFGFLLQILIGPEDGPGEEAFDVEVCTPKWLMRTYGPTAIIRGMHRLIVFEYDYARLRAFVEKQVCDVSGETWREVARQLALLGHWEFDNYVACP